MSVFWLQPQAWWGLAALATPIAVHLLARQRSRRLAFPSLRFLQTTRLAALRRRIISDWPLLIVRTLLLAVAVAALAAPVLVSDARRSSWNQRVARAIVIAQDSNAVAELVADETRNSFSNAVFRSRTIADGLRSADVWFGRQPPAAREVVIIGDLREGAVHPADLAAVAPHVGIRFLPLPVADTDSDTTVRVVTDAGDDTASPYDVVMRLNERNTIARFVRSTNSTMPQIAVRASAADQPHADAILRAVLREGVRVGRDANRGVTIVFEGAPQIAPLATPSALWARAALEQLPDVRGGELDGRLVVTIPMPATDARAASVVSRIANHVFGDSFEPMEPRRIAASSLAAWSRPPGSSPDTALPGDEGDRRFLWSVVLILLGIEQLMRRVRRRADAPAPAAEGIQEARVA